MLEAGNGKRGSQAENRELGPLCSMNGMGRWVPWE